MATGSSTPSIGVLHGYGQTTEVIHERLLKTIGVTNLEGWDLTFYEGAMDVTMITGKKEVKGKAWWSTDPTVTKVQDAFDHPTFDTVSLSPGSSPKAAMETGVKALTAGHTVVLGFSQGAHTLLQAMGHLSRHPTLSPNCNHVVLVCPFMNPRLQPGLKVLRGGSIPPTMAFAGNMDFLLHPSGEEALKDVLLFGGRQIKGYVASMPHRFPSKAGDKVVFRRALLEGHL